MATSDSDDFESADEEIEFRNQPENQRPQRTPKKYTACFDSDSDQDLCLSDSENKWDSDDNKTAVRGNKSLSEELKDSETLRKQRQSTKTVLNPSKSPENSQPTLESTQKSSQSTGEAKNDKSDNKNATKSSMLSQQTKSLAEEMDLAAKVQDLTLEGGQKSGNDLEQQTESSSELQGSTRRQRPERQRREKPAKPSGLGAKKLGAQIQEKPRPPPEDVQTPEDIRRKAIAAGKEPPIIQECWEFDDDEATKILQSESQKNSWSKKNKDSPDSLEDDVPEELKSNKSFKEVFASDGWEAFGDDKSVQKDVQKNVQKNVQMNVQKHVQRSVQRSASEEWSKSVPGDRKKSVPHERKKSVDEGKKALEKLVEKQEEDKGGWGSWGSWGVSSLLNSASVGVSTLTSHVSQGLTLLEESMGVPDPHELAERSEEVESKDEKPANNQETQPQSTGGFGLGSWMSGVSSITKLVEETGTKVITGGLGTLETIGKKTMEVLQEGDPGLKKKRAFFTNEIEKPILSQILREAKEKADVAASSVEEKQQARKVHFESLFDDFQGLVHLEALEMLSKQINMKIEQKLVTLDADEMISVQETLDEVKELCDLGEEEDEDDSEGDLKEKLKVACADLGVSINYDKLNEIWEETKTYVSTTSPTASDQEIFQTAISTLARFTAYSVERFHKTAELLLVKERRSTVNEADALVQLTKILSGQIGITAGSFSKCLNERNKGEERPKESADITTIFLEATNASSYIQDAFRLLIPILQVGAI